jgi:hypothetical protein
LVVASLLLSAAAAAAVEQQLSLKVNIWGLCLLPVALCDFVIATACLLQAAAGHIVPGRVCVGGVKLSASSLRVLPGCRRGVGVRQVLAVLASICKLFIGVCS